MAEHPTLSVQSRAGSGSGESRRLRREQRIPAILYGHGDPQPVSIDALEFRRTVSPRQYGSLIVQLELDGTRMGNALVKSVQASSVAQEVLNVDLLRVSAEDRLVVSVPVELTGEAPGTRLGGVLEQSLHALNLRCGAESVPDQLTYDISQLDIGESIRVADLPLARDCELLDDPGEVVAVVLTPTVPVTEESVEVVIEESEREAA